MNSTVDRRRFLIGAGATSLAAVSVPAVLGTPAASAAADDSGQRTYAFVSFSRAAASDGIAQPQIGMQGEGVFKPAARQVKGGGSFVFFDNAAAAPKPLLASGEWAPTEFVSYDTAGLPPYGNIQPAILEILADLEGVGTGLRMALICNVGAAGAAGMTGQPEGWQLLGTPFGDFLPIISPLVGGGALPFGITHLSVEGITIHRGA